MTDHGQHTEQTSPARAAARCAPVVEQIWTDPELPPKTRVAHWLSTQRPGELGRFGLGMKIATAYQRRSATDRVGIAVVAEQDRRLRDLRGRGWTVAEPYRPPTTAPLALLLPGIRELPSSRALGGHARNQELDPMQGQLATTLQRMSDAELARLGRKLARLKRQIQRVLDRLLGVAYYEFVSYVPPHDTSPCGVLRMASPEIPRGPQPGLHIDAPVHPWALAA